MAKLCIACCSNSSRARNMNYIYFFHFVYLFTYSFLYRLCVRALTLKYETIHCIVASGYKLTTQLSSTSCLLVVQKASTTSPRSNFLISKKYTFSTKQCFVPFIQKKLSIEMLTNYTNESISVELVQFLIKYRSDIVRARYIKYYIMFIYTFEICV